MTVSELIGVLQGLPQDHEVMIAYDYLACIRPIYPSRIFVIDDDPPRHAEGYFLNQNDQERGVYICAMDAGDVAFCTALMTKARVFEPPTRDGE